MENLNEEFCSRFKQILKKTIPERGELPKMLSEILCIEKMSVYRRLNGEIPFTFAEIITIAHRLNISLDNIVSITSSHKNLPLSLYFQDYFNPDEMDFQKSEDYLRAIKAAAKEPYSEFGFASDIFPLHVIILFPPIFRFFMMKWMYLFGSINTIYPYSEIHIPQRLSDIHREYLKEVQNIKYTFFIYHNFALQKLIQDIRYFRDIHLLTKEDMDILKDCLFEALKTLDEYSIRGVYNNGNRIDMYVSGLSFETSHSYLASDNINVSIVDAFTLGSTTSLDKRVAETMKKWMESIKKTSTIITHSEKNRIEFIDKQKKFIESI